MDADELLGMVPSMEKGVVAGRVAATDPPPCPLEGAVVLTQHHGPPLWGGHHDRRRHPPLPSPPPPRHRDLGLDWGRRRHHTQGRRCRSILPPSCGSRGHLAALNSGEKSAREISAPVSRVRGWGPPDDGLGASSWFWRGSSWFWREQRN
jgi:hypothetical protein